MSLKGNCRCIDQPDSYLLRSAVQTSIETWNQVLNRYREQLATVKETDPLDEHRIKRHEDMIEGAKQMISKFENLKKHFPPVCRGKG